MRHSGTAGIGNFLAGQFVIPCDEGIRTRNETKNRTHMKTEKLLEALKVALVAKNKQEVKKLEMVANNLVCARWCGATERLVAVYDYEQLVCPPLFPELAPPKTPDIAAIYRQQNAKLFEFVFAKPDAVQTGIKFEDLRKSKDVFYVKVTPGGSYKADGDYSFGKAGNILRTKRYRLSRVEERGGDILTQEVVRQIFSHYYDVLDVDVPRCWEAWRMEGDYFVFVADEEYVSVRIVVAKNNVFYLLYFARDCFTKVCGVYYEDVTYYVFADVRRGQGYADIYVLTKKETLRFLERVRKRVRRGTLKSPGPNRYYIEYLARDFKPRFRLDLQTKTVTKYE